VTVFGIGIDVVENARIAEVIRSHGQRFLDRVYQPGEIEYCRSMRDPAPHFAARFAAKEAISKAFGTGFAHRINWRDIEVRRKASGEPFVVLHAGAAELANRLNIETVLVSLSHSQAYAVANALLLKSANQ
jgi:holo-[acyl-carrier protein] synthase